MDWFVYLKEKGRSSGEKIFTFKSFIDWLELNEITSELAIKHPLDFYSKFESVVVYNDKLCKEIFTQSIASDVREYFELENKMEKISEKYVK